VLSVFRVPPEVAGQRVDVFLHGQLKRTSRTRAQYILRVSAFTEDGRRLRPGSRVKAEQKIMLWRAPWDEDPVPTDVPILHEDEHLFVVNKPANLPVHPSARYHKNTLIKVLERDRPDAPFLSLGHRLDRETSGALVVSKSSACDRAVKRLFERRDGVAKTYLAITHCIPEGLRAGLPLRLERSLELDPTHSTRVKMRVGQTPDALASSTVFHLEATARGRSGELYARIRCDLETGRQHQIRVHLASLGAHIVGDKLYGKDDRLFARGVDGQLTPADLSLLELPRHALHAARIAFPHPLIEGARLDVVAPLPDDLARFWASLTPSDEREQR
jgi:23S rRNA pseudouridine1911/1915/1917 synthase